MTRRRETFPYYELGDVLTELVSRHGDRLRADDRGRCFEAFMDHEAVRLTPPLVLPPPVPGETASDWLGRLPRAPGVQLLLLLQAGAAALGFWRGDELVDHKVFRRYVVRGTGVAQTTHLKTKGKSRYGSRLRLQNFRRLLEEVNERLTGWWEAAGGCEAVFYSCPVRTWPELFAVRPAPPFDQRDPILRRIPLDVHAPRFEELVRVRHQLERATLETEDA